MSLYRMIALDLDGTTLSPLGRVTPATKAAIHRALGAGLLVCFATGRNYTESQPILDEVGHFPTAVFVGGAMVIDTEKRVTLHRAIMGMPLAREVCAFLESHGHAVLAMQDTEVAGVDYLVSSGLPLNEATRQWMIITRATLRTVPTLGDHEHVHTVRVGIIAPSAEMAVVKSELVARFGDRIYTHSIHVQAYGVEVLEVFEPAVNKWEGILFIARRHGIGPQEIVAVGDDVNDLPMLREAGLGVAMGNAKPEIQAAAKQVIGPNSADGLAIFINSLIDDGKIIPPDPATK